MKRFLKQRKKLLAYIAGVTVGLIALGVFHGTVLVVAQVVIVLVTGGGIHRAQNAPYRPTRFSRSRRR